MFRISTLINHYRQDSGKEGCLTINNGTNQKVGECTKSTKYACMKPVVCPHSYEVILGGCYRVHGTNFAPTTNKDSIKKFVVTDTTRHCNHHGGGLARPTSLKQVKALNKIYMVSVLGFLRLYVLLLSLYITAFWAILRLTLYNLNHGSHLERKYKANIFCT